jgi:hypothetical protein
LIYSFGVRELPRLPAWSVLLLYSLSILVAVLIFSPSFKLPENEISQFFKKLLGAYPFVII